MALDVETAAEARTISDELSCQVGGFKIGLQLFTVAGSDLVREFVRDGKKVFLDLKFHDIPATVAKASAEAARLGVWMFNVHAAGGSEMMKRAVAEVDETCSNEGITRPLMIGVTVLTSSTSEIMNETGVRAEPKDQVLLLTRLASESGLDGVVASPHEVIAVKEAVSSKDFLVITPGIRSTFATGDDQKRVTTLRQALAAGSDFVVIGRPITQAEDRGAAVDLLVEECLAAEQ